ncbi:MAG: hypothetical protein H0T47_03225 [Planctomycetaceae bacterium]|nr:hypothetical protein [Planctomycetaceae bacterium]
MTTSMVAQASLSSRIQPARRGIWRRVARVRFAFRRRTSTVSTTKPRTIRRQLLVAVNAVLGVMLGGLLFANYQRGIESAIDNRQETLVTEAVAIHRAVMHLGPEHGAPAVQSYLDAVCSGHGTNGRSWHHIVVERGTEILQVGDEGFCRFRSRNRHRVNVTESTPLFGRVASAMHRPPATVDHITTLLLPPRKSNHES